MDTVRVFVDCMDFSFPEGDGWEALCRVANNLIGIGDKETQYIFMIWMLRLSSLDIKFNFIEASYAPTLNLLMSNVERDSAYNLFLSLGPTRAIDAVDHLFRYSCLMTQIIYHKSLFPFLSFSPDLHFMAYDPLFTPYLETPTSLAMYSSGAFHSWLAFLYLKQVDIVNFVEIEMDQKVLIERGWSQQTLQTLFGWDFAPSFGF